MAPTPRTAGPSKSVAKPPVVKVSVTAQGGSHGAARTQAVQALGKEMTKGPGKPQKAPASPGWNPATASDQQIGAFAQRIVGQQSQAQLIPLRQQAAQLANQQQTVSNRYAGYAQQGQGILAGLQDSQQATALTNENAQAQAAMQTANQIDASGQAAAALNAGYQGPEAQAALANTRQFQGTVQGAQAGYLAGQAGNNQDLLTALRGTAALQATQGQRDIAGAYQKDIGTNLAAQREVIAKQPASVAAERVTLGDEAFNARILAKKFGLDKSAAKLAAEKVRDAYKLQHESNMISATNAGTARINAQTSGYNAVTSRMNAKEKVNYDQATTAWRNTGLTDKRAQNAASNAAAGSVRDEHVRHDKAMENLAGINTQLKKQGLTETKRSHLRNEALRQQQIIDSTKPGSKSSKASTTYAGLIGGNAAFYEKAVSQKGTDPKTGKPLAWTPQQAAGDITKRLRSYGPAAAASIDFATKGYVTDVNVQALKQMGITLPAFMTTKPAPGKKLPGPLPPYSGSTGLTKSITAPIG